MAAPAPYPQATRSQLYGRASHVDDPAAAHRGEALSSSGTPTAPKRYKITAARAERSASAIGTGRSARRGARGAGREVRGARCGARGAGREVRGARCGARGAGAGHGCFVTRAQAFAVGLSPGAAFRPPVPGETRRGCQGDQILQPVPTRRNGGPGNDDQGGDAMHGHGRVGSPGHEPPGEWVAPPGLGVSDGQHHATTHDQNLIPTQKRSRRERQSAPCKPGTTKI